MEKNQQERDTKGVATDQTGKPEVNSINSEQGQTTE